MGDFQLSYGLVNAMQAMQFKMQVEKGEMSRHPFYGLPSVIGLTNGDTNAIKDILTQGIRDIVANDDRFDRIETISVNISLGSAIISLVVRLAGGGNTLLPINFIVNTG